MAGSIDEHVASWRMASHGGLFFRLCFLKRVCTVWLCEGPTLPGQLEYEGTSHRLRLPLGALRLAL